MGSFFADFAFGVVGFLFLGLAAGVVEYNLRADLVGVLYYLYCVDFVGVDQLYLFFVAVTFFTMAESVFQGLAGDDVEVATPKAASPQMLSVPPAERFDSRAPRQRSRRSCLMAPSSMALRSVRWHQGHH